jgi:phosphohistidine phosphatase
MARQLWLLRHGEAVPHGSRGSDDDRELTPHGEHQASVAGEAMARLGIELTACYTSPKVRGRDTARLACRALNVEPQEAPSLRDGFDRRDAEELLLAHDGDARVLLVGHEPDFSQMVHDLTGGRVDLKKGGVAGIKLGGGSAELIALLRPRDLEAIAGR